MDGPLPRATPGAAAVLVPVKAFAAAKARLAGDLDGATRAELARAMAARVLGAAGPLRVFVVCDDDEVRAWAQREGAAVVWTPGLGLNGAVEAGVAELAGRGFAEAVVAHADLPLADRLDRLAGFPGVTLVPDRHRDGTNVACVPTGAGFRFSYGPGSFAAHRAEAARVGGTTRIVADEALAWDVDVPADLALPAHLTLPTAVAALVPAPRPDAVEA